MSRIALVQTSPVYLDRGAILNRHGKLMPTRRERMIGGFGDALG
jgi:hypothetical protein